MQGNYLAARRVQPHKSAAVSKRSRRPKRPERLSVPVAPDDYDILVSIVAQTSLKMSAVTRLLLHRGVAQYQRDGHLS